MSKIKILEEINDNFDVGNTGFVENIKNIQWNIKRFKVVLI